MWSCERIEHLGHCPARTRTRQPEADTRGRRGTHRVPARRSGRRTARDRPVCSRGSGCRRLRRTGQPISERAPKLSVGSDQGVESKGPIEPARVRQNPGRRPGESIGEPPPANSGFADHRRKGSLAEERDNSRSVAAHLRLELRTRLPELVRRYFIGPSSCPGDHSGYATAVFEQPALLGRMQAHVGETGEVQHRPEAITAVGEVVTIGDRRGGRIDSAEDDLEVVRQNVCVVTGQPGTNAALLAVSAAKNPRSASAICARIGAPETTTSTMVSDRCVCPRARTCCVETPAAASASA